LKIVADKSIAYVEEAFSPLGTLITLDGLKITPDSIKDADVLLVGTATKVNRKLLEGNQVRFAATVTTGFDHIDVEYLKQKGIGFAHAPGSNANSVAEYVVVALLEIANKYGLTLENKSIGIIGVGRIGSRVAKKCTALGMQVLLNDPPLFRKTGDKKYLPLKDLFDCDFITLHTPLTLEGIDKTYHLADEIFFNSLKNGSVFINTARGAVEDTIAVKNAIKSNKLKAVVIDVWENEPDIDTELLEIAEIATPHIAGYSLDGKVLGMIMVQNALCEFFGIADKKGVEDFLPPPEVAQIEIENAIGNEQEILRQTVKKIYDITKDDAEFKKAIEMPKDKAALKFHNQRRSYHFRREFQNTTVHIRKKLEKLAQMLTGIGFKIELNES